MMNRTTDDHRCFDSASGLFLGKSNKELVVFDVGCNINMTRGDVLVDFTGLVLGSGMNVKHVYAFEPVHWRRFEERYEENSQVSLVKQALSDGCGNRTIYCPKPHGLSSLFHRDVFKTLPDAAEEIAVTCNTVDNFMKQAGISHLDYLKIDVEGAELMVLKGATNALKNGKISGGQFEFGDTLKDAQTSLADIESFLKECGYHVCFRYNSNCVFVKDSI